ncbi:MAG TPA: hypothetical protein VJ973_11665, partial [Christiangramia sp.]|nr:hypothetical protein [Christiangramia sp.]
MFRNFSTAFLIFAGTLFSFSQTSDLSVQKIMQDPNWMGTFPENVRWGIHGENIYFDYNPEKNASDSLYRIEIDNPEKILKVSASEKEQLIPQSGDFNSTASKKVYTKDGDLYLYDLKSRTGKELLDLPFAINSPEFLKNEDHLVFTAEDNAFVYDLKNGSIKQLTHFKKGSPKDDDEDEISEKDEWLQNENLDLLQVVKERKEGKENSKAYWESNS